MQITNAAERLTASLETKARRPWNPDLHPRDSKGRFVETGGIARLWGGGMARVLRALGGRNVLVQNLATNEQSTIHASRLTMVARPDGTAPTRSKRKVRDEDERRMADGRRGTGNADADDTGDQGDTPDDPHDKDDQGDDIGEDVDGEDLGAGPEPDDDEPDDEPERKPVGRQRRDPNRRFKNLDDVRAHWAKGKLRPYTQDKKEQASHTKFTAELMDKLDKPQLSRNGHFVVGKMNVRSKKHDVLMTGWGVIHVETGVRLTLAGTKAEAVDFANSLENFEVDGERIDWNAPDAFDRLNSPDGLKKAGALAAAARERFSQRAAKKKEGATSRNKPAPATPEGQNQAAAQQVADRSGVPAANVAVGHVGPKASGDDRGRPRNSDELREFWKQGGAEGTPESQRDVLRRFAADPKYKLHLADHRGFAIVEDTTRDDDYRFTVRAAGTGRSLSRLGNRGLHDYGNFSDLDTANRFTLFLGSNLRHGDGRTVDWGGPRLNGELIELRDKDGQRSGTAIWQIAGQFDRDRGASDTQAARYGRRRDELTEEQRQDPETAPETPETGIPGEDVTPQPADSQQRNDQEEQQSERVQGAGEGVLGDVPARGAGGAGDDDAEGDVLRPAERGDRGADRGVPGRVPGGAGAGSGLQGRDRADQRGDAAGEGEGPGRDAVQPAEGTGDGGEGDAAGQPAEDHRGRVAFGSAEQERTAPQYQPPEDGRSLVPSGVAARVKANIAAIEVLRRLEDENRPATAAEQETLARWSGWGATPQVFVPEPKPEFAPLQRRLRELLSDDEYEAAKDNTLNAHYTDPSIAIQVWKAVQELGFDGGNVLEPGSGSGNFIGHAPEGAHMTGVELDPITAGIAKALYPQADIRNEGFEKTRAADGTFDLTIGNVPFGDYPVTDLRHNKGNHNIHNAFILKSLDLTRPGGLVAVVTSRFTMDGNTPRSEDARMEMARKADLVGAVRLPTGAHRRTAGTDVVTDLLIFRRREKDKDFTSGRTRKGDVKPPEDRKQDDPPIWVHSVPVTDLPGQDPDDEEAPKVSVNPYFLDHPRNVVGDMHVGHGMYGPGELRVHVAGNLNEELGHTLKRIVGRAKDARLTYKPDTGERRKVELLPEESDRPDGHVQLEADGTFTQVRDGMVHPYEVPKTQIEEARQLVGIRDSLKALVREEARPDADEALIETLRGDLKARYDAYHAKFGALNRFEWANRKATDPETGEQVNKSFRKRPPMGGLLTKDPTMAVVLSLDSYDETTKTSTPAAIFTKRQARHRTIAERASSPEDAMAIVLEQRGTLDTDALADVLGVDPQSARERLLAARSVDPDTGDEYPLVFEPHNDGDLVPAAEYLSGNVRERLAEAQALAADDARYEINVKHLEDVLPEEISPGEIDAPMGAAWLGKGPVQAFLRDKLGSNQIRVSYQGGSMWKVDAPSHVTDSRAARKVWGTSEFHALKLAEAILTNGKIRVTYKADDGKTYLDEDATAAAQAKADEMREEFQDWLWATQERTEQIKKRYNDLHNNLALRSYDGQRRTMPGLVEWFKPHAHQHAAVARMVSEPAVLLAHEVGAGKTAEMTMGVMELRRLGLVNKAAIVVPNHMLNQFRDEFAELYPESASNGRILAASTDDLTGRKRREFIARVATGDYDAVILTQTAFESIPMRPEVQLEYIKREKEALEKSLERQQLEDQAANPGKRTDSRMVKEIRNRLKKLEAKITAKVEAQKDMAGLYFEDTGIDYVVVDEAHHYKNLSTNSTLPGAAIEGSNRASDLDMKLEYLRKTTKSGRVVTFATATPISNSITEAHTMLRYLRPDLLEKAKIRNFDDFASTYGKVVNGTELAADGSGFREVSRFAAFRNMPELLRIWRTVADVKNSDDLAEYLDTPDVAGGKAVTISVEPTDGLLAYMDQIAARARAVKSGDVDPTVDNMLKINSDGRKVSLDPRMVGIDEQGTKLPAAADNIARIYTDTKDAVYPTSKNNPTPHATPGGLQIVFLDMGTPVDPGKSKKKKGNAEGAADMEELGQTKFPAYQELKELLIERGVPAEKIRFIHEAKNDAEKAQLFADARNGKISVLLGSTTKMGVGTNVQLRATALHHLDCPWRPADLEQRNGRIIRQGNANPEVAIFQYVTEGSFDGFAWQTVARKAKFIRQLMKGSLTERTVEDIPDGVFNAEQVTAISTGNPYLLEQANVKVALGALTRKLKGHLRTIEGYKSTIYATERLREHTEELVAKLRDVASRKKNTRGDDFNATIGTTDFTKRDEASKALATAAKAVLRQGMKNPYGTHSEVVIGKVGGIEVTAKYRTAFNNSGRVHLVDIRIPDVPQSTHSYEESWLDGESTLAITRIEDKLADVEKAIVRAESRLRQEERAAATARERVDRPFEQATELEAAERRSKLIAAVIREQGREVGSPEAAQEKRSRMEALEHQLREARIAAGENATDVDDPAQAQDTDLLPRTPAPPSIGTDEKGRPRITWPDAEARKAAKERKKKEKQQRAREERGETTLDPEEVRNDLDSLREGSPAPAPANDADGPEGAEDETPRPTEKPERPSPADRQEPEEEEQPETSGEDKPADVELNPAEVRSTLDSLKPDSDSTSDGDQTPNEQEEPEPDTENPADSAPESEEADAPSTANETPSTESAGPPDMELPKGMRWARREDVRPGDVIRFYRDGKLQDDGRLVKHTLFPHLLEFASVDGRFESLGSWRGYDDEYVAIVDKGPDRTAGNRYIKRYGDYMRESLARNLQVWEEHRQERGADSGEAATEQSADAAVGPETTGPEPEATEGSDVLAGNEPAPGPDATPAELEAYRRRFNIKYRVGYFVDFRNENGDTTTARVVGTVGPLLRDASGHEFRGAPPGWNTDDRVAVRDDDGSPLPVPAWVATLPEGYRAVSPDQVQPGSVIHDIQANGEMWVSRLVIGRKDHEDGPLLYTAGLERPAGVNLSFDRRQLVVLDETEESRRLAEAALQRRDVRESAKIQGLTLPKNVIGPESEGETQAPKPDTNTPEGSTGRNETPAPTPTPGNERQADGGGVPRGNSTPRNREDETAAPRRTARPGSQDSGSTPASGSARAPRTAGEGVHQPPAGRPEREQPAPADMTSDQLAESISALEDQISPLADSTDPLDLAMRRRLERRQWELENEERRRWTRPPQRDDFGNLVEPSRDDVISDRLAGYDLNDAEVEGLVSRVEELPEAKDGAYSDEEWERISSEAAAREDYPPTDEQNIIIEGAARRRLNMAVMALAGTGKSSTLKMLSHRMPDRNIVYLAFNRSVAAEAREAQARGEYAKNMLASTANAYAARVADRRLNNRLPSNRAGGFKRLNAQQVADRMRWYDTVKAGNRDLTPGGAATVAERMIREWAKSSDAEMGPQHVKAGTPEERRALFNAVKPLADRMWANLTDPEAGDPDRDLPMDFDYIVKQWALSGYKLDADVLFWDEAQDVNPVMEGVVRAALDQGVQVVAVGDSNQAIYGFRGASDALAKLPVDARATLTQSFRFGPAVANVGNRFLRLLGTRMRLKGFDRKDSRIGQLQPGEESMVIARTNAGVALAAVQALTAGRTVAVSGGVKALQEFVQAANALAAGEDTDHAELARFNGKAFEDIIEEVKADPDLQQLASLFNLLEKHGDDIEALLSSGSRPAGTELVGDRVWVRLDWNDPQSNDLKRWLGDGKNNGVGKLLYDPATRRYFYEPGKREVPWKARGRSGVHKIDNRLSLEEAQQRIDAHLANLYPQDENHEGTGRLVPEHEPHDVLVTTAHKAKGLESERVRIADDFKGPEEKEDGTLDWGADTAPSDEALRVAYVAVTRATEVLDPGSLGWVFRAVKDDDPTQPPKGEYRRDFEPADLKAGDQVDFLEEDGTPNIGVISEIDGSRVTVLSNSDEPGLAGKRQEIGAVQVQRRNGETRPLLPVASDKELDDAIAEGRYGSQGSVRLDAQEVRTALANLGRAENDQETNESNEPESAPDTAAPQTGEAEPEAASNVSDAPDIVSPDQASVGDYIRAETQNTAGNTVVREGHLLSAPKMVTATRDRKKIQAWSLHLGQEGEEPSTRNRVTILREQKVERLAPPAPEAREEEEHTNTLGWKGPEETREKVGQYDGKDVEVGELHVAGREAHRAVYLGGERIGRLDAANGAWRAHHDKHGYIGNRLFSGYENGWENGSYEPYDPTRDAALAIARSHESGEEGGKFYSHDGPAVPQNEAERLVASYLEPRLRDRWTVTDSKRGRADVYIDHTRAGEIAGARDHWQVVGESGRPDGAVYPTKEAAAQALARKSPLLAIKPSPNFHFPDQPDMFTDRELDDWIAASKKWLAEDAPQLPSGSMTPVWVRDNLSQLEGLREQRDARRQQDADTDEGLEEDFTAQVNSFLRAVRRRDRTPRRDPVANSWDFDRGRIERAYRDNMDRPRLAPDISDAPNAEFVDVDQLQIGDRIRFETVDYPSLRQKTREGYLLARPQIGLHHRDHGESSNDYPGYRIWLGETPDEEPADFKNMRVLLAGDKVARLPHIDSVDPEERDSNRPDENEESEESSRPDRDGRRGDRNGPDETSDGSNGDGGSDAPGPKGDADDDDDRDEEESDTDERRRRRRRRDRDRDGGGRDGSTPDGGLPRIPGRDRDRDRGRDGRNRDRSGNAGTPDLDGLKSHYRSGDAPTPSGANPQEHAAYLGRLAGNDTLALSPSGQLITWSDDGRTWQFGHAASGTHLAGWEADGEQIGGRDGAVRLAGEYENLRNENGDLIDWAAPELDLEALRAWTDAEGNPLSAAVEETRQNVIRTRTDDSTRQQSDTGVPGNGDSRTASEPADNDQQSTDSSGQTGGDTEASASRPADAGQAQYAVNAIHYGDPAQQRAGFVDGRRIPTANELDQYETGENRIVSEEGERALFGSPEQMRALASEGFVPSPVLRNEGAGQVWRNGRLIGSLTAPHEVSNSQNPTEVWWSNTPFSDSPHFSTREAAIAHLVLRDIERGEPDLSIVHPDLARTLGRVDEGLAFPEGFRGLETLTNNPGHLERYEALRKLTSELGRGITPSGNVADDLAQLHDELRWLNAAHYKHQPPNLKDRYILGPGWFADKIGEYLDVLRPEDPRARHHQARKNRAARQALNELATPGWEDTAERVPAGDLREGDIVFLEGRITGLYPGAAGRQLGYVVGEPKQAKFTADKVRYKGYKIAVAKDPFQDTQHTVDGKTFLIPDSQGPVLRLARAEDVHFPLDEHQYGRQVGETPGTNTDTVDRGAAPNGVPDTAGPDAAPAGRGRDAGGDANTPSPAASTSSATDTGESSNTRTRHQESSTPATPGNGGADTGRTRQEQTENRPDTPAEPQAAPEPVNGRPAEWVQVSTLQNGDLVRIDGESKTGTARTLAGYVVGESPKQLPAVRKGRSLEMYRVLIADTPDARTGKPVWVPLDAAAARAARDDADQFQGSPQTGADSDVLTGRIAGRVPTDANGNGLFPGSLVTDDDGNEGVVTGASANSVRVQFGDDRTDDDHSPTSLNVTDGGAARPAGWTPDGHRVAEGNVVGNREGNFLGTVQSTHGDAATIATPNGMQDEPIFDLRVIGDTADDNGTNKVAAVEPTPAKDVKEGDVVVRPTPNGPTTARVTHQEEEDGQAHFELEDTTTGEPSELTTASDATVQRAVDADGNPPEIGPEDAPANGGEITVRESAPAVTPVTGQTVDPQLTPEEREAITGRGPVPTGSPEAQEGAARIANDLPLTPAQATALAEELREGADSATPEGRAAQRAANRLDAAAGNEPVPSSPQPGTIGSVGEGDTIALPDEFNPNTMTTYRVVQVQDAPGGVRVLTVEDGDGMRFERTLASSAPLYQLPEPEAPAVADDELRDPNPAPDADKIRRDYADSVARAVIDNAIEGTTTPGSIHQLRQQIAERLTPEALRTAMRRARNGALSAITDAGIEGDERDDLVQSLRKKAATARTDAVRAALRTVNDLEPLDGESEEDMARRAADLLRLIPQALATRPVTAEDNDADAQVNNAVTQHADDAVSEALQAAASGGPLTPERRNAIVQRLAAQMDATRNDTARRIAEGLPTNRRPGIMPHIVAGLAAIARTVIAIVAAFLKALAKAWQRSREGLRRMRERLARFRRGLAQRIRSWPETRRLRRLAAATNLPQHGDDLPLGDRIAHWARLLPAPGRFGQVSRRARWYRPARRSSLAAGELPEVQDGVRWTADRAADGGPGPQALRHLAAVRAAGQDVDADVIARLTAAAPELGDDPHGTVRHAAAYADSAERRLRDLAAAAGGAPDTDAEIAAARVEAQAARQEADQLQRAYAAALPTAVRDTLAQVRDMGPGATATLVTTPDSDSDAVRALTDIAQFVPRDWLSPTESRFIGARSGDAGAYDAGSRIATVADLGDEGRRTAAHALLAHLQQHYPDLLAAQEAFHFTRTHSGRVGARRRTSLDRLLAKLFRNSSTGRGENGDLVPLGLATLFSGDWYRDDDLRAFLLGLLATR
ncbi:UvrD-helicase domain-containing protein [Streptomyces sp. NPDC004267]|uniref:UvrD-helicase domain-containing protein n=1 Tax=Streptomyces sp. NPDC004267 TaxID=3364694 RepID=UPI0036831510